MSLPSLPYNLPNSYKKSCKCTPETMDFLHLFFFVKSWPVLKKIRLVRHNILWPKYKIIYFLFLGHQVNMMCI